VYIYAYSHTLYIHIRTHIHTYILIHAYIYIPTSPQTPQVFVGYCCAKGARISNKKDVKSLRINLPLVKQYLVDFAVVPDGMAVSSAKWSPKVFFFLKQKVSSVVNFENQSHSQLYSNFIFISRRLCRRARAHTRIKSHINTHTQTQIHAHTHLSSTLRRAHVHRRVPTCTRTHAPRNIFTCVHIYIHIYRFTSMYTCIHVYIYVY